ncbi:MAG TPA: LysR family transcriptional regulator [Gemmatimonadales bacterium]|jgi:DNA-binding transcriptional LysR family regulator|nr:LysR family transcriptional regulator [Gemmatimonadales bacterium]
MLLKHLQYLTALARERHFARAAAACQVTQPTLSAGIKQLEEQLGLLVVQRGHRFEGLTVEGERVLAWAQRITADAESLEQEASRLREVLEGRLRLGVVPAALPAVPILASPLARRYPGVTLTIVSTSSADIQLGLDEFRFEAGITYLENEPLLRVRTIPLYREQYLLITPAGGPLAGRTRVTWREAASLPLCLLTPDMQNRRILNAHFAQAGASVTPSLETNSVFTLCTLVRSGYWSSVLPYGFQPLLSGADGVALLPLEAPAAAHTVGLVVSDRHPLPPTATALLDVVTGLDWSLVEGETGGS